MRLRLTDTFPQHSSQRIEEVRHHAPLPDLDLSRQRHARNETRTRRQIVKLGAAPDKEVRVTPDGTGTGKATLTTAEVTDAVSIEVRDPHGNGGTIAF